MIGRPSVARARASSAPIARPAPLEQGVAKDYRAQWPVLLVVFVLALGGLLLPVRGTAAFLVGVGSPVLAKVVTGVWIFKACLLLHAALLFGVKQIPLGNTAGTLAVASVRAEPLTRGHIWALGVVLAAGIAARFIDLGAGLWFDEIRAMLFYGGSSVGQIIATYDSQNQHLLYSL